MEDLTVVKALNCSGAFGEHFEKKSQNVIHQHRSGPILPRETKSTNRLDLIPMGIKKNTSKSQYGSKSDILRQFSVCRKDLA